MRYNHNFKYQFSIILMRAPSTRPGTIKGFRNTSWSEGFSCWFFFLVDKFGLQLGFVCYLKTKSGYRRHTSTSDRRANKGGSVSGRGMTDRSRRSTSDSFEPDHSFHTFLVQANLKPVFVPVNQLLALSWHIPCTRDKGPSQYVRLLIYRSVCSTGGTIL